MSNGGYIKLYRRMMKWGWYTDTPTKCVFLHLLFLACYETCYYKGVQLEPGQTVASVKQIATDTNLTVSQVRTALEHLKMTNEITQSSSNKFSVFTINNYCDYQSDSKQDDNQIANKSQTNRKPSYIKKNKEDKEYNPLTPLQGESESAPKPKSFVPPTPEEVNAYCKERGNGIDGSEFVDFYQSKGWLVGKSKMKDWKAAVRTWEKSRKDEVPPKPERKWLR